MKGWQGIAIATVMAVIWAAILPLPYRFAALASFIVGPALVAVARWCSNRAVTAAVVSVVLLALLSLIASAACDFFLGGTALLGRIEGNAYYLGSHGHYTQVDRGTYRAVMLPDLLVTTLWPSLFWLFAAQQQYTRNARARLRRA